MTQRHGGAGDEGQGPDQPMIVEDIGPCEALDKLLKAVGQLPLNFLQDHPNLYQATMRGLQVIDKAVKENRYVVVKE